MGLGLLHLHDHIGAGENLGCAADDLGTDPAVHLVAETDAGTGVGLDDHLVTVVDEFTHAAGRETDAVFVGFDFLGYADQHGCFSCVGGWRRTLRQTLVKSRSGTAGRFFLFPDSLADFPVK